MMISPEEYYNKCLRDKSVASISREIKERDKEITRLQEEIEYANFVGNDITKMLNPGPDVRIKWNREYLDILNKALKELGSSIKQSNRAIKDESFNSNIEMIDCFSFTISGFFSGHTKHIVHYVEDKAEITISNSIMDFVNNVTINKDDFVSALKDVHIGEWRKRYDPIKYGVDFCDGTQWEIQITYKNGLKTREFYGNNLYPYNFESLLELFKLDR